MRRLLAVEYGQLHGAEISAESLVRTLFLDR